MIVILVNDPDFEGGEGDFGGKAMTYYGRWTYKYEEAARRGAAGVLIVHETEPASYGWATVKNSNTNTMFDIVRQNPAAEHPPLERLDPARHRRGLFKNAGLDFEAAKAAAKRKDFQPVDLKANLGVALNAKTEVITSTMSPAACPARTRPDETVIYIGAPRPPRHRPARRQWRPHLQRRHRQCAPALPTCSSRHALSRPARGPQRSVLFLAVAAEEKGLLGTEYYAANPLYPLAKTAGVHQHRLHGHATVRPRTSASPAWRSSDLLDMLVAEGEKQSRYFSPDPRPEAGGFFRSDHFPFAKDGVPAISFRSGNDLVERRHGARQCAGGRLYEPNGTTSRMTNGSRTSSTPAWCRTPQLLHARRRSGSANSCDWPNWSQDSEFRAARDRSAAERQGACAAAPKPAKPGERG